MQLVQFADAVKLTGLTAHQLREWCGRRGLVSPDVSPGGRGRHALYSWQTILALRVLRELHERFGVEVGAWKASIANYQTLLQGRSFPGLFGMAVVFYDTAAVDIVSDHARVEGPHLICPLDSHLNAISLHFKTDDPRQLPLISTIGVRR